MVPKIKTTPHSETEPMTDKNTVIKYRSQLSLTSLIISIYQLTTATFVYLMTLSSII